MLLDMVLMFLPPAHHDQSGKVEFGLGNEPHWLLPVIGFH